MLQRFLIALAQVKAGNTSETSSTSNNILFISSHKND